MKLVVRILNRGNGALGNAQVTLNWGSKTWRVDDSASMGWKRVTRSRVGSFEVKDWNVVWLWDKPGGKGRNIAVLWDAPRGLADKSRGDGSGRLFDPEDASLKQREIQWTLVTPPPNQSKQLSPRRQKLVTWLNTEFKSDVNYGTTKYNDLTGGESGLGGKSSKPGYTNCLILPGIVSAEIAKEKGHTGKKLLPWLKKNSLTGTYQVRDRGRKLGAWISAADSKKRPIPGDIFALLKKGATHHETDGIGHVGVFLEYVSDTKWKTADFGQGDSGYTGRTLIRDYDPTTGKLTSPKTAKPPRVLAGWVDLDLYFKGSS